MRSPKSSDANSQKRGKWKNKQWAHFEPQVKIKQ